MQVSKQLPHGGIIEFSYFMCKDSSTMQSETNLINELELASLWQLWGVLLRRETEGDGGRQWINNNKQIWRKRSWTIVQPCGGNFQMPHPTRRGVGDCSHNRIYFCFCQSFWVPVPVSLEVPSFAFRASCNHIATRSSTHEIWFYFCVSIPSSSFQLML